VVHGYKNEARWKYLMAVAKLSRNGDPARTSDLSHELNVTPASVTEMMGSPKVAWSGTSPTVGVC